MTTRTLILYRASAGPRRVVGQLEWLGYDDKSILVIVDSKNKKAVAASATCYEVLSHPPATKTITSQVSVAAIGQAIAKGGEEVVLLIGEDGLESVAHLLAGPTVKFDVSEAAMLEIDDTSWAGALGRSGAWKWLGTISPEEGR